MYDMHTITMAFNYRISETLNKPLNI